MHTLRDGIVALSLWALAMVVEIVLVTGVLPVPASFNLSRLNNPLGELGLQPLAAVVALVLVGVSMFYRRQPPKSAGWNRLTLRNGLLVGAALGFLTIFLRGRFNALFSGLNSIQLKALWLVAVICLAEETVFRGFLQLRLGWWLGKTWGLLLAAGLFVLWRLPFYLAAPDTLLINLAAALVQGLLLGWIMQSCGNVTGPAIYRIVSMWCNFL